MSVEKIKTRHVWLVLLSPFFIWYLARPQVVFHFSPDGKGNLGYVLNIQHSIHRGDFFPGGATGGAGHIFPNDDFFMQFDWNNAGRWHCVSVVPKWPTTNIYIGADGALDKSRTDMSRLVKCDGA